MSDKGSSPRGLTGKMEPEIVVESRDVTEDNKEMRTGLGELENRETNTTSKGDRKKVRWSI